MPGDKPKKPSVIIEGFWWLAFIVPMIFAWMVTQSVIIIGVLLAIRIGMIVVPKVFRKKEKPQPQEPTEPDAVSPPTATVNTKQDTPNPYIEEARAEWYGLLKFLRIYDKEKEEKNLMDYRRFRGWE